MMRSRMAWMTRPTNRSKRSWARSLTWEREMRHPIVVAKRQSASTAQATPGRPSARAAGGLPAAGAPPAAALDGTGFIVGCFRPESSGPAAVRRVAIQGYCAPGTVGSPEEICAAGALGQLARRRSRQQEEGAAYGVVVSKGAPLPVKRQ